jgi:hypothetical protein
MSLYRIVRRARRVDIVDAYGRCVDTVMDPGGWSGAPEPQLAATDAHLVELIEQGEQSGRYQPRAFEDQRVYDSTTGTWSWQRWPTDDQ